MTELIVHVINPFGLEDALEGRMSLVMQQIGASTDATPQGNEIDGQDIVTVMLLDRDFARSAVPAGRESAADPVWPLPVSTLMLGVVKRVLAEHPAVVFVDLAFPSAPREESPGSRVDRAKAETTLADYLRMLGSNPGGVPVFFSDVIEPSDPVGGPERCPYDYVDTVAVPGNSVMAQSLRGLVFHPTKPSPPPPAAGPLLAFVDADVLGADGGYRLLPLATGGWHNCRNEAHNSAATYIASPALALYWAYADVCQTRHFAMTTTVNGRKRQTPICPYLEVSKPPADPATPPRLAKLPRDTNGMVTFRLRGEPGDTIVDLRWRSQLSGNFNTAHPQQRDLCDGQLSDNWREPLTRYLAAAAGAFGPGDAAARPCIYIDTIKPGELLNASTQARGVEAPRIGDTFVTNRIVLIGAAPDLRQANDIFDSPINGHIAGVYAHAVALENLLSRGQNYARTDPGPGLWCVVLLIDAVILTIVTLLWEYLRARLDDGAPALGTFVVMPVFYLVSLFAVIYLLSRFTNHTRLPMVQVALPVAALHLELFRELVDRIVGYPGRRFNAAAATPE